RPLEGPFDHLEECLLLGDAHPNPIAFEAGEIALGAALVLTGTDVAGRLLGVEFLVGLLECGDGRLRLGLELLEVGAVLFDGESHGDGPWAEETRGAAR